MYLLKDQQHINLNFYLNVLKLPVSAIIKTQQTDFAMGGGCLPKLAIGRRDLSLGRNLIEASPRQLPFCNDAVTAVYRK